MISTHVTGGGISASEQEKMSREELRLLCQRVKLIDTYLDTLGSSSSTMHQNKKPLSLTNGAAPPAPTPPQPLVSLPSLRDALALDIPFDLKQRIANSTKTNALLPARSPNTYQFAFTITPPQLAASQPQLNSKSNGKSNGLVAQSATTSMPPAKKYLK